MDATSAPAHNKVLIIEDDTALRDLLKDKFTSEGFEIETAEDGVSGLQQAIDWKPDLILLDIVMPKMDGLTLLHKLRDDDAGKKTQVILLTNLSDTQKVYEAMANGVFDYLVKSNWEIDDLVAEVRAKLTPPTQN